MPIEMINQSGLAATQFNQFEDIVVTIRLNESALDAKLFGQPLETIEINVIV